MNEYTTALLQIVSTKISDTELTKGIGLRNHARKQPEPPEAYYCFESATICDSNSINDHIQKLDGLLSSSKTFIIDRVAEGDQATLLWFPSKDSGQYSILSPRSMRILSNYCISFLTPSGQ